MRQNLEPHLPVVRQELSQIRMIRSHLHKFVVFFFVSLITFAQKPCEFDFEVKNDSIDFRETKKHLIYEREFGKKSNYAFVSLLNDAGYVVLNYQRVQKSDSFIETECFDKNTRMYLQLTNGKIYTLIHSDSGVCSTKIPDLESKSNIRMLNTSFFFMKDDFEDLKKFPVAILQIRFATGEKTSYVMEKELISKNLGVTSNPEKIFIDYFHCIE